MFSLQMNIFRGNKTVAFLILLLLCYGLSHTIFLWRHPELLLNFFGVLALMCYGASLSPGIVRTVLPHLKSHPAHRYLAKHRRYIGVASFAFACLHTVLAVIERDMNFLDPTTYVNYATGLISFGILVILTLTSNDHSVKALKKRWINLHKLTYALVGILPLHLLATMKGDWSNITPVSYLVVFLILVLFVRRWSLQFSVVGQRAIQRTGSQTTRSV